MHVGARMCQFILCVSAATCSINIPVKHLRSASVPESGSFPVSARSITRFIRLASTSYHHVSVCYYELPGNDCVILHLDSVRWMA